MLKEARHIELLLYDPLRKVTVEACQEEEEKEMRSGHSASGEVENCFERIGMTVMEQSAIELCPLHTLAQV